MTKQPFDVVGWAYGSENYSHAGIISQLILEKRLAPAALIEGDDAVEMLNLMADTECLDEFEKMDSEVNPQPIFRDQVDAEMLENGITSMVRSMGDCDFITWREALENV